MGSLCCEYTENSEIVDAEREIDTILSPKQKKYKCNISF